MIEFRKFISREMMDQERNVLFVFGDNLQRRGFGGQAREMRNAKHGNSVGIPTKRFPARHEEAYFRPGDLDLWKEASIRDWDRLIKHIKNGGKVVWPEAGIGTDRADLEARCPEIFEAIQLGLDTLIEISNRVTSESILAHQSENEPGF